MAFTTKVRSVNYVQAVCSCTWEGPKRETRGPALTDLTEHYKEHAAEQKRHDEKAANRG